MSLNKGLQWAVTICVLGLPLAMRHVESYQNHYHKAGVGICLVTVAFYGLRHIAYKMAMATALSLVSLK